jgi:hypothetical protein
MSRRDAVEAYVRGEIADCHERISAGRGTWPNRDYVTEDSWSRLYGRLCALEGVLRELESNPEAVPEPAPLSPRAQQWADAIVARWWPELEFLALNSAQLHMLAEAARDPEILAAINAAAQRLQENK